MLAKADEVEAFRRVIAIPMDFQQGPIASSSQRGYVIIMPGRTTPQKSFEIDRHVDPVYSKKYTSWTPRLHPETMNRPTAVARVGLAGPRRPYIAIDIAIVSADLGAHTGLCEFKLTR